MTDTIAAAHVQAAAPRARGLLARTVGAIFSPGEVYADVAARPRVFGVLVLSVLLGGAALGAFLLTEVGREAMIEERLSTAESFGFRIPDERFEQIERRMENAPYFAIAQEVILQPLLMLIEAAVLLGVFNVVLGGDASYKQVLAIVAHASLILALQKVFVAPLDYARASMASATSLIVFFPGLDDTTFLGQLLGGIDLFRIWWLVNLAIGLAVVYKKKGGPIGAGLLTSYAVVALALAIVWTVFSTG